MTLKKDKAEKEKEEEDDVKEGLDEVAPPGWEGTIKKMKGDKNIDNPWALAWWMKSKGYKPNANEEVWHREQKALGEDFVSNNMGSGNINYRDPLLFSKKKQKLVKRKHPAGTMMAYEGVDLKKLKKEYEDNEDRNNHTGNYLLLAKAFGSKSDVKKVQEIMKRNQKQGHTSKADNDWMYKNINPYYSKIRNEEVEIEEAVLADRDYKYDGKVVKISKKNFSKVHKDYKNSTKGKETMLINDPKTNGTISVPVQFEGVEVAEAKMSDPMIAKLKDKYESLRGKRLSLGQNMEISKIVSGMGKDKEVLLQLVKADIPFISLNAATFLMDKHGMKAKDINLGNKIVRKQEIKSKIIDDSYHGTFAGDDVFIVDSNTFHTCRLGKQKYHRYEKYVGDGKIGQAIREFGLTHPKKPIILQNGEDGPMLYLRYGGSKRYA